MSKKRHTRTPHENHNLEVMMFNPPAFWRLKKDIPMLMRITKDTSIVLGKGQE
jgi:hypothetical protein